MDPPPGMASTPVTHTPWDSKLWSTNEKVSKELKPFDGSHVKYKIWASRLKDHFIKRNPDWQFLLTEMESHKFPVTKNNPKLGFLKTEQYTIDIDCAWTATTLWTFIGEHVVDSLYNIRKVLAGGGGGHGGSSCGVGDGFGGGGRGHGKNPPNSILTLLQQPAP